MKFLSRRFIVFSCLIFIADFVIENLNHKFQLNDFKVYYSAATAIATGKQVYDVAFSLGSGYYKYSPFIAILVYPIGILPYYGACIVDFLLISAATILASSIILELLSDFVFSKPFKSAALVLSLSFLCILTHLARELELGNVNVILLLTSCLSLRYLIRGKKVLAGIFLGLVIITKPFFILLFIPLIIRRYFVMIFSALGSVMVFIFLPAILLGIDRDLELHRQWLNAMLVHAAAFPSPNTLDAIIRSYFSLNVPSGFQYFAMLLLLIPYLVFSAANWYNRKNGKHLTSDLVMEWFVLLAILPSLLKTDTEHFLMTLPIIVYLLNYLIRTKNFALSILFVLLMLFYAGNISDLIGKKLSLELYNAGVLGISNILITTFAVILYIYQTRKKYISTSPVIA